ncbi:MAG: flagellar biosynthesis protein FlhF [Rhodopirellula sp.]|nr:flagellar biosynthesis protein FlhF [Rhodopirellula sp.]
MNEIRTFKAQSMQEALAIVRRELGSDAVILNTRQVTHRRLLPFLKKRQQVEVTAGVSVGPRSTPVAAPRPVAGSTSQGTGSFSAEVSDHAAVLNSPPSVTRPLPNHRPSTPIVSTDPTTPLARAAALAMELERHNADKAQLQKSLNALEAAAVAAAPSPAATSEPATTLRPAAQHPATPPINERPAPETKSTAPTQRSQLTETVPPPANQAAGLQAAAKALSDEGDSTNELSVKLDVLQKMVESLAQKSQFRNADEVPSELFEIYTQLIDADIDDDLARELICNLRQNCSPEQLHDSIGSRALLSAMVEADIKCASPIRPEAGRRRVVALVGPTGVGKTTTIAKLAANFRLRDGIKMGLVTVDTYRIAAVEQLRTYAEIIDLPMKVVTSPQEMRRALDELSDLDLILIDTAGRSPRDELKIQELKSLLNEANVDEVHLVMSLTASVRSIKMTCEQFRSVNPTALILTKLDEAAGAGSLLSISRDVKLPFSYLTTGQDVPEDIEPANSNRIARLVLGADRLFD